MEGGLVRTFTLGQISYGVYLALITEKPGPAEATMMIPFPPCILPPLCWGPCVTLIALVDGKLSRHMGFNLLWSLSGRQACEAHLLSMGISRSSWYLPGWSLQHFLP